MASGVYGKLIRTNNLKSRIESVLSEPNLSSSSKLFVESLHEFVEKTGGLTDKQIKGFEKIESIFCPQNKEKLEKWTNLYKSSSEMKETIKLVAHYYLQTKYYNDLSRTIIEDPTFVPTQKQYDCMVNNKYSQAVIESTRGAPYYPKNTLVKITHSATLKSLPKNVRGAYAFVVDTDTSPVTSGVRGGKKYKIIPFGHTTVIEIEERYLKAVKGKVKESEGIQ